MVRMMGATDYRGQTWDSAALTSSQVRARERRQWLAEWDPEIEAAWHERSAREHLKRFLPAELHALYDL